MKLMIKFDSIKELIVTHKLRNNLFDELEEIGFKGHSKASHISQGNRIERTIEYRGILNGDSNDSSLS
jgi:hypothetical protein